jgi:hypothetical protein
MALLGYQERHACDERLRSTTPALSLAPGLGLQQHDKLGGVEVGLVLLAGELQKGGEAVALGAGALQLGGHRGAPFCSAVLPARHQPGQGGVKACRRAMAIHIDAERRLVEWR